MLKLLLLIYYLTTGTIGVLIMPKLGSILTRKTSNLLRDRGDHKYRNIVLVPAWAVYYLPTDGAIRQSNLKLSISDSRQENYYKLLCYDLNNEPLRHDTVENLLNLCLSLNDYQSGLDNALKQKRILEYHKDTYYDDRYEKSMKRVDYCISKCQKAIEKNCYSENYNLCFVDDFLGEIQGGK